MTDSLRSVTQQAQMARQRAEEEAAARKARWWSTMPAEARAALLAVVFLAIGLPVLIAGVGVLVGLVVSPAAGVAAGAIVLGITLTLIGVLFGLSK